jgi:hypothetical protein
MIINENSGRYEAKNEDPIVLCSYGESPADAFKQMAKLLKKSDLSDFASINAVNTSFEEGIHYVTVYI